jgi:hypothetical protein
MPNSTPGSASAKLTPVAMRSPSMPSRSDVAAQRPRTQPRLRVRNRCDRLALAGYDDWRLRRASSSYRSSILAGPSRRSIRSFSQTPSVGSGRRPSRQATRTRPGMCILFGYPKTDLVSKQFRGGVFVPPSCPHRRCALRHPVGDCADVGTGLLWQRSAPDGTFTFDDARTYCSQ